MKTNFTIAALTLVSIVSMVLALRLSADCRELSQRVQQLERSSQANNAHQPLATPVSLEVGPSMQEKLERLREKSGWDHSDGPPRYIPATSNGAVNP